VITNSQRGQIMIRQRTDQMLSAKRLHKPVKCLFQKFNLQNANKQL